MEIIRKLDSVILKENTHKTVIPYVHTWRNKLAEQNSCFWCDKVISSDGQVYIDKYGIFYCSLDCLIAEYGGVVEP